jgi:hypothetical protein
VALVAASVVAGPVRAQERPVLANDGGSLASEPLATRAMFESVYGGRAATQWVAEHEAEMAIGAPAHPVRVGFVAQSTGIGEVAETQRAVMLDEWRKQGYAPGRDVVISWYYPQSTTQPLDGLAAEMASLKPDLMITASTPAGQAVSKVAGSMPLIFSGSGDPLGAGIVSNLDHPGGNVTGAMTLPLSVNQTNVDLLREVVPGMSRLAILRSATNPLPGVFDSMREAAERRGIAVQSIVVQKVPDDIPAPIDATAAEHADARSCELIINLKTAQTLGLTVPDSVRAKATKLLQ